MDVLIHQFFNLDIMARALPLVLAGLRQTVLLCLIVIPLGLIGGLVFALASLSSSRTVRWGMIAAIDFFRAVPPLVLLIFVYSGLPFAGIRLSPLSAVALAFFLNTSSYYGEIYRAGIESVGRGQWDAARSTGLATSFCRRRSATCCPISSPTPWRWSSSPRSPAWSRCPSSFTPPTW